MHSEYRFHPTRKWRFDAAWPDRKIAVEINGGNFVPESKGRGAHARGSKLRDEYEKLGEAAVLGWRIIPVLPEWVEDGTALERIVRAFACRSG